MDSSLLFHKQLLQAAVRYVMTAELQDVLSLDAHDAGTI